MTKTKLSPAQDRALAMLTDEWQTPKELDCGGVTLWSLVNRGLADVDFLHLRSMDWHYRKAQKDD